MKNQQLRFTFLILIGLFINWTLTAQISGKVTSADEGMGLVGVTVVVKGTSIGAISDFDGSYTIDAKSGDVLTFSYIGMINQEVTVGNASTLDVVMAEDATTLSDVIITATRQPIRKLEATTAVNVVNEVRLEEAKPEGIAEAINGTPGMYSSFSQGRFRGAIFTRGFPDGSGNGLVYTGILMDGLPTLATTARPPDFALGMDPGVERVEVVRGSAATLFGRSSAAGVVNVINRTGGTEHHGSVRFTNYNNNTSRDGFDMKIDGTLHGPISDNIRYNVGGYYVNDRGFRDLGYNDRGGQLRANVDFLLNNNSKLRVFGSYVNVSIQNMIDIPFVVNTFKPRNGWETTNSFYFEGLDDLSFNVVNKGGEAETRSVQALNEDGNYARGGNFGAMLDYNLNDNLTLSYKGRYQSYDHGTKFNLGVSTFYTDAPFSHIRVLIDGDGNDTDIMNELRLTYTIGSRNKHRISVGTFLSQGNYTPETYSLAGWHTNDREAGLSFHGFFPPPTFPPPTTGSPARVDEYQINTTAFFLGDEIKFGDKLTTNIGFRWDRVQMDLQGFYDEDADGRIDVTTREEEHSDYSASIGFNYLLSERSALYGNAVRAYRMPDYSAYTALRASALTSKPTIENNEIVNNFELGYRTGIGDLGIDVAGFYTKINNRLATVYEGAIATLKPLGTNQIVGGELALTYAPTSVKGLLVTTSLTLQNATFLDFKIPVSRSNPNGNAFGNTYVFEGTEMIDDTTSVDNYSIDLRGNQLPRVPSTIWNFNLGYNSKYFGANVASNLNLGRFPDATNVFEQDPYWLVNAGLYGQVPIGDSNRIRLTLTVKNLLNSDTALRMLYVSDNDAALGMKQALEADPSIGDATYFTGIPILPRRILITLGYDF